MATNRKFAHGSPLSVAVASPTNSNDPVLSGALAGVALTDYDATTSEATVAFDGVYELSVKGVDGAGNVAVAKGDRLYFVTGDTPVLSKKTSGVFFGYALETVDSGATATIEVRLAGGDGRSAADVLGSGTGLFISAETTGTGSNQNIAHGLGRTPTKVAFMPTEFASNVSVDFTPGTHTGTNVVVSVGSGVKFQVIAY